MIVSPICEMLGIKYPIFQGGMAWIADGKLAAAVSNGGGLGIISAMNAGGDYLQETRDWGKRFIHVHLKGAVKIEGKVYDNPPAGMDQTDWTSFMGILYGLGYDGGLSIEPESAYWHGELSDRGVDYTIRYFRNMMIYLIK